MSQPHFDGSVRSPFTFSKMGLGSPLRLSKTQNSIIGGQNTSHWNVLYIVEKVSKWRCPKWPHMSHLDICSTSYGQKKGWESNWQFDSQPLKVKNWPDSGVCRWSATHRWKALEESYKFVLDLVPIGTWGHVTWYQSSGWARFTSWESRMAPKKNHKQTQETMLEEPNEDRVVPP